MQARFIGANGSLGYRTGRVYDLDILPNLKWINLRKKLTGSSPLAIQRKVKLFGITLWHSGLCPYDSEEAFAANWEVLD